MVEYQIVDLGGAGSNPVVFVFFKLKIIKECF